MARRTAETVRCTDHNFAYMCRRCDPLSVEMEAPHSVVISGFDTNYEALDFRKELLTRVRLDASMKVTVTKDDK